MVLILSVLRGANPDLSNVKRCSAFVNGKTITKCYKRQIAGRRALETPDTSAQVARMSDAALRAQRAEIERRYRRKASAGKRTAPQLATLRLNDLAKLFRARYGITLPNDDAGRDDLYVALSHIAMLSNSRERMARYVEIWAPWLTVGEARQAMDEALTNPRKWKADQLAWRVRLTAADRTRLGITTIGAIDLGKAARTKLRKAKARDRERARRARLKAACAP